MKYNIIFGLIIFVIISASSCIKNKDEYYVYARYSYLYSVSELNSADTIQQYLSIEDDYSIEITYDSEEGFYSFRHILNGQVIKRQTVVNIDNGNYDLYGEIFFEFDDGTSLFLHHVAPYHLSQRIYFFDFPLNRPLGLPVRNYFKSIG